MYKMFPPVENLTGGLFMALHDCRRRIFRLLLIFTCSFALLGCRLLYLQLLRGEALSLSLIHI